MYCKAQSNLWYLVPLAGKKQPLAVQTNTKYLAQAVANMTLAKRQSNAVRMQQKHLVRMIPGGSCTASGQKARRALLLLFPWNREECCTDTLSPLLFPCLNRCVTVFTSDNYLLFCPAGLSDGKQSVPVKVVTLASYCQHSGFFSGGRWKTHLYIANKNSNELAFLATHIMFFDSVNYFRKPWKFFQQLVLHTSRY